MLAAGETIWRAGPVRKGCCICHGTAGNGYAFLKLFKRTGDEKWLERARRFAAHSIDQCEAAAQQFGQYRYSLWTGDIGLAIFLWGCINGDDRIPTKIRKSRSIIPRAARALRPVSAAPFWASAVMSLWLTIPTTLRRPKARRERETVSNWWSELSTTRLNDPKQSAIVVIMQRLHEADVSGTILSGDEDWCHLMIPMEYDWRRHCLTSLEWNDPRGLDDDGIPLLENGLPRDAEAAAELDDRTGELMWPERFGAKEVEAIKTGLGPYMASGRLQQSPQPKGGGIFKSEWWQLWEGTHFPIIDLVIASLDSAFTGKARERSLGANGLGHLQTSGNGENPHHPHRRLAQALADARLGHAAA